MKRPDIYATPWRFKDDKPAATAPFQSFSGADKELLRIIETTTSALDHVLQFARIPRDQRVFFNDILNRNRRLIKESKDANQSSK